MRLFVAIALPTPVVRSLSEIRGELEPQTSKLRWVRLESIHLTLKFLGEVSPPRLGAIEDSLARIRGAAFKVSISGVGFFPNNRAPRVLWAGVRSEALEHLAGKVDAQMIDLDFPPERRKFTPHLTLARSRGDGRLNPDLVQTAKRFQNSDFGEFTADRFHLYESRLDPSGAIYKKLGDYPLE